MKNLRCRRIAQLVAHHHRRIVTTEPVCKPKRTAARLTIPEVLLVLSALLVRSHLSLRCRPLVQPVLLVPLVPPDRDHPAGLVDQ